MNKSYTVEEYFKSKRSWHSILDMLREFLIDAGLKEEIKWGSPVYTYKGKNVIGLAAFKSYCGLWFFQGALLKDPSKKLISGTEGVTKAQKQMRFYSELDIDTDLIKRYINEAVDNCKKGKEIKPEKSKQLSVPVELKNELEKNPDLKKHFGDLGITKKREFAEYISEAKQDETKRRRLEMILPLIMSGIGLNDRYR